MRFLILLLMAVTAHGANLVPNSSFEVPGRWTYTGETADDQIGNLNALASNFIPTAPFHGNMCWSNWYGSIYSRAMRLTAGTCRVSVYLKAQSGGGPCNLGLVSLDNMSATVPATPAVTSSWARYSTNQTVPSNGMYYVKITNPLASATTQTNLYIDAVQCEYGTSLTAYAPMNTVEIGMETSDPDNRLFLNDSKVFKMRYWNESTAVTVPQVHQIYDVWNRKTGSATNSVSVATGSSTNTYSLPLGTNGYLRLTARLADRDNSWAEIGVNVFPFTTNSPVTWQVGQPHSSPYHVRNDARLGFYATRTLSPASVYRWYTDDLVHNSDIEHVEGVPTWVKADAATDTFYTNGLKIFASLQSDGGTSYPPWATNKTRTQFLTAWSNYVHMVTARYTNKLWACEIWNEPYSPGAIAAVNPFSVSEYTNYAQIAEIALHVIKANSPTTITVFGCYDATGADWLLAAYTNMSSAAQNKVDVISVHRYPSDGGDANSDPNVSKYDPYSKELLDTLGATNTFWLTEVSTIDSGGIKGMDAMFNGNYDVQKQYVNEVDRDRANHRSPLSVDRHMNHLMRWMGAGFEQYTYYDRRRYSISDLSGSSFTGVEVHGPEKACSVAYLISRNFLGVGLGRSTNTHIPYDKFEIYKFTNSGNAVLGLINSDRTNRTFGVTNSDFYLFDLMGNVIQKTNATNISFGRTSIYVVSTNLTITQLSETLRYATVSSNADTEPPAISIDIAPSGVFDTSNPMTLVKWTAIDRQRVVTVTFTNSVLHRWKLDGGSYTDWSQSNHVWIPFTAGDHTFTASAKDESGNTTEEAYRFALTADTPPRSQFTGPAIISGKVDVR